MLSYIASHGVYQVVMPTVEADVAFGLGKSNFSPNEVRLKVSKALASVGMSDYMQVGPSTSIIRVTNLYSSCI